MCLSLNLPIFLSFLDLSWFQCCQLVCPSMCLPVCLSVCLSVCKEIFLEMAQKFFLIFCMKLRDHKHIIFSIMDKNGSKWTKNGLFILFPKFVSLILFGNVVNWKSLCYKCVQKFLFSSYKGKMVLANQIAALMCCS